MAVETTVISIAAIDRLRSRETTVSGRLVFIAGNGCLSGRREATGDPRRCAKRRSGRTKHDSAGLMRTRLACEAAPQHGSAPLPLSFPLPFPRASVDRADITWWAPSWFARNPGAPAGRRG